MSKQNTPMNRADYLLSHLAQECNEVAIRCTKAQMFGLDEIQPGQELTNRERIMREMADVLALCEIMRDEGILFDIEHETCDPLVTEKKAKAVHFSGYSRELGRLVP